MESHNGEADDLPPPPPIPPNVEPIKAEETKKLSKPKSQRSLISRPGFGKKGQQIQLFTNHFKVSLKTTEEFFYHYYEYEDDRPVDGKGVGRKVIDKLQQTYASELANKDFAYDGEKSLFTIGALPQVNNEFSVVLEDVSTGKTAANGSPGNDSPSGSDRKRVRRPYQMKTFKVELCFAAKIPMSAIAHALRGQESENTQEAIRVIDIILRQHSAKQGCLLVRQSFFHNNPSNFVDLGGGVMGCRGFHSSFRATQSGLSLNIDVSTTMIVKPSPVIDFLLANQKVDHPNKVDWAKVLRRSNYDSEPMLKACGISIAQSFTQIGGRVLQAPKLKAGNGEDIFTRNGRWNFNNKRLIKASIIEKWAVVNFSARCNVRDLVRDLIKCGGMKGIVGFFISPNVAHFHKCIFTVFLTLQKVDQLFMCLKKICIFTHFFYFLCEDYPQIQCVIDHQGLPCLLNLLTTNHKKSMKEEACWTISNIIADSNDAYGEATDLQGQLIEILDWSSRMVAAQLEAQNINCQLDREQRKDQDGKLLRAKFLVDLLNYNENESKDNIPEVIREILNHIRD